MTIIKKDLGNINWSNLLSKPNCQLNYNTYERKLTNILDTHAPVIIKQQKCRIKTEPWITPGIKRNRHKQKKLYKEFLLCQSNSNDSTYKSYRNTLKRITRKAKIKYYNNKCVEVKNNMKNLWFIINCAMG